MFIAPQAHEKKFPVSFAKKMAAMEIKEMDSTQTNSQVMVDRSEARRHMEKTFGFTSPASDAGIVSKRQWVEYKATESKYQAGDQIQIKVSSAGSMLDPTRTFLRFRIQLPDQCITDNMLTHLPIGAQGLFDRVVTETWNGTEIDRVENYNLHAGLLDQFLFDDAWRREYGLWEGYPIYQSHTNGQPGFDSNAAAPYSLLVEASAAVSAAPNQKAPPLEILWQQCQSRQFGAGTAGALDATKGLLVKVPLRYSALWGGAKNIPLRELAQLNLKITLAEGKVAFRVLDYATNAAAAGDQAAHGYVAASEPTDATVVNYQISDVSLVTSAVTMSADYSSKIQQTVAGPGLPIFATAIDVIRTPLQAGNISATTTQIQKNAANVVSVLSTQVPSSYTSVKAEIASNNFTYFKGGLKSWQVRLGSVLMPSFRVQDELTSYEITKEAIPFRGSKKSPTLPAYRYTTQMFHRLSVDPAATGPYAGCINTPGHYYYGSNNPWTAGGENHAMEKFWAGSHCFGLNLQTSPGVPLSGISTSAGQTLTLECEWYLSSDISDADYSNVTHAALYNELQNKARYMLTFLYSTKILIIGPNNSVTEKK